MATMEINDITDESTTLLNALHSEASASYQSTVPVADGTNTYAIGQAISAYTANQNEFLNALVNRIGLVLIKNMIWSNPLSVFKKGLLENGETIEEIFADIANIYDYEWDSGGLEPSPFAREIPDVKAYFHTLNSRKKAKTTVTEEQLNLAFTTPNGIYSLVDAIIQSLYGAFEIYEWETMKNLLLDCYNANDYYSVTVTNPTNEEEYKALVKEARTISSKMTFPNKIYNAAGVTNTTPRKDQVVLITPELEAGMDVEVLASAFNMDKTTLLGQMVIIDQMPEGMEDVVMAIVDRDWFFVYDKNMKMHSIFNPDLMYWNYWFHFWQLFSYSKLEGCVLFKTA